MKIVVYGAGAVGAFFGGMLVRYGQEVQFVARGENLEALRTKGIVIDSTLMGPLHIPPVPAAATAAHLDWADLVLVCVKAHHTSAILDDLAAVVRDTTIIVPLQNGVESDEVLAARFGRGRVATAVVYLGATLEAPGVVSHVAPAAIVLGARLGFDPARLPAVRDRLALSGQQVTIARDILHERWYKLMWTAGFNTVSALTGRTPADLLALPELRALVIGLMREVVAVANAQGIMLRESDIIEQLEWTTGATALRTSMMVDRERGRSMETDALVGVVLRKGRELAVPTPLSGAMYALLLAADSHPPIAAARRCGQSWGPALAGSRVGLPTSERVEKSVNSQRICLPLELLSKRRGRRALRRFHAERAGGQRSQRNAVDGAACVAGRRAWNEPASKTIRQVASRCCF